MISSASAVSMSLARRLLPSPLRMPSQASRLLASSSSSSPEETAHSKEDLERRAAKMQETLVKPRRRRRGPKPDSSSSDLSPMSVAMKFYLDRKRQHDAFMAHERREFDVGRRHLANMMRGEEEASGEDLMGQEEIDKAVEYLFPSGLRHPGARPLMKPPEEVRHKLITCVYSDSICNFLVQISYLFSIISSSSTQYFFRKLQAYNSTVISPQLSSQAKFKSRKKPKRMETIFVFFRLLPDLPPREGA